MKKFLVCLLALATSLSVLAACASNEPVGDNGDTIVEASGLSRAKEYLYTMYKDANEVTPPTSSASALS